MFQVTRSAHDPIMLNININGVRIPMELDIGAAVSIILLKLKNKYFPDVRIDWSKVNLKTYTGEVLALVGCGSSTMIGYIG